MSEFSCKEVLFDGAKNPVRCKCKPAALKAYNGMLSSGAAEKEAFDAAYRIYRYHHPLDTKEDSHLTVERWIYTEQARAH